MSNSTSSDHEDMTDSYYTNLPSLNLNSLHPSSSVHTSPLSPDEMVIRSRGRRQIPYSFSPDRHLPPTILMHSRYFTTPTRTQSPPNLGKVGPKNRSASRLSASTERVRRQLEFQSEDNNEFSILKLLPVLKKSARDQGQIHGSEVDFLKSHTVKKLKISSVTSIATVAPTTTSKTSCPLQLAKALSKPQLLDLLSSLTRDSDHLKSILSGILPKPDLKSLVTNLTQLNQNIYKALPVSRLSGLTDSLAYKQVAIHLVAFKKSMVKDLELLPEAGQWDSLLEYVTLGWEIVIGTPLWDNPVHNRTRVTCFKNMAASVIRVLKHKEFIMNDDMKLKLVRLMIGSPIREVHMCKEKLLECRK